MSPGGSFLPILFSEKSQNCFVTQQPLRPEKNPWNFRNILLFDWLYLKLAIFT